VALAQDLDTALHRLKFPREHRPFQPHLTVARVRRAGPAPDLSGPLDGLGGLILGTQPVDALHIMESTLNPSGAIHRPVDTVRLSEVG
jgi:2'-5' RNA ligase